MGKYVDAWEAARDLAKKLSEDAIKRRNGVLENRDNSLVVREIEEALFNGDVQERERLLGVAVEMRVRARGEAELHNMHAEILERASQNIHWDMKNIRRQEIEIEHAEETSASSLSNGAL